MRFVIAGFCLVLVGLLLPISHWHRSLPLPSPSPTPSPVIQLLFTGDMMLDRNVRKIGESKGYDYIFDQLTPIFTQADLVVSNLEGPITTNASVSLGSVIGSPQNYTFTFSPTIPSTLVKNNIKLVNLGNNHILNFGKTGLDSTIKYLTTAGIDYFGNTGYPDNRYFIKTLGDKTIGFVNYNQFVKDGDNACLADIAAIKDQTDVLIVYTHWGIEYQTVANQTIQSLAHSFIDTGADIIIGSHPHVVQQTEIYNGKYIYYSLGNFIFDQYFSPETQSGLLVKVTIDQDNTITTTDFPISIPSTGQIKL
jgi:poly-gamma-glutamate synthesis protein (capsule biosynthesis protein)